MNADTGIAYELGQDEWKNSAESVAHFLVSDQIRWKSSTAHSSPDETAAAVDAARGDAIVRVDAAAAQRARLGDRELRRRRQRRR